MKRITILMLFVFFGAAFPAKAAPVLSGAYDVVPVHYRYQAPAADAIFECTQIDKRGGGNDCPSPPEMSPFAGTATNPSDYNSQVMGVADIECPVEDPTCYSDYDVYYWIKWTFTWAAAESSETHGVYSIHNYLTDQYLDCGTGLGGTCTITLEGIIPAASVPSSIGATARLDATGAPSAITETIEFYFSLFPRGCDASYDTPTTNTYVIDPTIETPQGVVGDPAPVDEQIFRTVEDQLYRVEIGGGPWNDGTGDRTDAAISWDGATWTPLTDVTAECQGQSSQGVTTIFIIAAVSETFEIRVNDTAGNFADNTVTTDFTYTIGAAYELPPPCEDQYTYSEADLVDTITVNGNETDGSSLALEDLVNIDDVIGKWYAIKVVSGTWQDEGAPPDRTDMELKFDGGYYPTKYETDTTWKDFGTDEYGVGCQSTDESTWYVQARNFVLHLRVNNETGTFTNNTGSLNVSIYQAEWERPLEQCEYAFESYGSPYRDEVAGDAANGKSFAYVPDPEDPFAGVYGSAGTDQGVDVGASWSVRPLEPGAWYMLDTIDGPWYGSASSTGTTASYEMSVDDGSGWVPLEDWTVPTCNVATDSLGHRRLYFQVPAGPLEWFLRVDDSSFGDNSGSMAWNLYRSIEKDAEQPDWNPWISCLDNVAQNEIALLSPIPVKDETGTYIKGNITASAGADGVEQSSSLTTLSVGYRYAVVIAGGPWDDDETDETEGSNFDAAVSNDNGLTWHPLDKTLALGLCVSSDQEEKYFTFSFQVQDDEMWKIRVNDETGDFGNNGGSLYYNLWQIANVTATQGFVGGYTACNSPIFRPSLPTNLLDVPGWLQWVGEIAGYVGASIRRFFSFCPSNISAIIATINQLKTREPLASVYAAKSVLEDVTIEIASYDWGDTTGIVSIFDITDGSDLQSYVDEHFFPIDSDATNPWDGDDIINPNDFDGSWQPSAYYTTCLTAFTGYLPSKVAQGVCFASAAFRDTGASFWIQLAFDIGCVFLAVRMTKRPLQEAIYMMTGVKPWTQDGAIQLAGNAISGDAFADNRIKREIEAIQLEYEKQRDARLRNYLRK